MGLGWHEALVKRRPLRLLAAYGASTGIHALWNGAALAVAIPSLLMVTRPEDILAQGIAGLVALGSLVFLLMLTASMVVVMLYLTRRAGRSTPEAVLSDEQIGLTNQIS